MHLFEIDLDPLRIMRDLGLLYNKRIDPHKTLLVFDEIQLYQPALTSLKYFAEQSAKTPIIAIASLNKIVVHRQPQYSFPVGKVDIVNMHPLDFEEYLWAHNKASWAAAIRECFTQNEPFPAHRDAINTYHEYLMVGGLPAATDAFITHQDFEEVRSIQRNLAALYTADMSIYLDDIDASRTLAIWDNIPRQLARDSNNKFKLADIKTGARYHQYEAPFTWLENAGLIFRHRQSTGGIAPFEPRGGGSYYKSYLLDVGMLSSQLGIRPDVFLDASGYQQIAPRFRGALAENYVKQALQASAVDSFYWSSGNTAEVDFLIQDSTMQAVPIEVKSGDNLRSKSLKVFRDKFAPSLAMRLSLAEFGEFEGLKTVPLYAAFCIKPNL